MATAAQSNVPSGRVRALIIPREHGAWGMLFVPLVTGAAVAAQTASSLGMVSLFAVVALALFWLRTPVESLFGAGPMRAQTHAECKVILFAISALGSIASVSLTGLFLAGARPGLLTIGAVAATAFLVQAGLKKLGRRYYMAAQIVGSIGLTSTAPAAYYVASGRLDATAAALWFANWVFAGNQIHFVQLRIHAARVATAREKLHRGTTFIAGQVLMVVALALACGMHFLPLLAILAFFPVLLRGFLWFTSGQKPLAVKRLGWTELAHAVSFGLLLIAGFLL